MNAAAAPSQPEYLESWSLRCHPFEQRLDPQFFYAGSALMQRLDLLTHLVQFGESIVVVSGPPGSGKSTLLGQFLGHISPQWVICTLDGEQADQLAERLAETIGGNPDDGEQALLARWAAQSDTSQHLVLVIDNAERLDEAACKRLCEFTDLPDSERVRIVLFGTAEAQQRVRETLERLTSKRTSQMLEIPRLTEEETASYLMYRLAVAGYSGESPFTPTEVRAICKAADGRPGAINRLAHEALGEHHARARHKKRSPAKRSTRRNTALLWIVASVAIAAVAGYLGWQRLAPTSSVEQESAPPQAFTALPLTLPATHPALDETDERATTAPQQPASPPPQDATGAQDADGKSAPAAVEAAAGTAAPPPETTAAVPPAAAPTTPDGSAPLSDVAETTATEDRAPTAQTPAAVADNAAETPVPAPPTDTSADSHPATVPEPTPGAQKPADTTRAALQRPASPRGQPHREDWLLQQPPGAFTLQLLGSRDEASITHFIQRYALEPDKTAYYRGRYKNAEWYVLLYGIYPDKAAALAARSALPDKVQKGKPWPRSLKSVQDSIREVQ